MPDELPFDPSELKGRTVLVPEALLAFTVGVMLGSVDSLGGLAGQRMEEAARVLFECLSADKERQL